MRARSLLAPGALALFTAVLAGGCAGGLIPTKQKYVVEMNAVLPEGRGDFSTDPDDSSTVFSKEGLLIKVKPLSDEELNRRFPPLYDGRHVNPYTFDQKEVSTSYIPPRFTVFDVAVINNTYAKIQFDPAKAVMVTGDGRSYRYYDPGREGHLAEGGNSFSKYYRVELGISGYEKELALERMGVVYKSVYHRDRPVFKEDRRQGLLVFDPLPQDYKEGEVVLHFNGFVLSFDASGKPENTVDVEFRYQVKQGISNPPRANGKG
ncbi:MAG: hypothetical protein FJY95_21380 [Candidatus Handelsmanbacteria bacterium]|nr:hypothetical protein [Candidatus Handelsmanbacteria bacterium]